MIKKEIIDNFGFDRSTLDNWEKGTKEKRKLLFETLKALPIEFVDNIKEEIKAQEQKDIKLREALGLD